MLLQKSTASLEPLVITLEQLRALFDGICIYCAATRLHKQHTTDLMTGSTTGAPIEPET